MTAVPDDHPPIAESHVGVLVVNLGTPAAPDAKAVRAYLREFLSDPRVVELPRWLWWPILHGPILAIRPRRTARLYARIWDHERGESPLRVITRAQAASLGKALAGNGAVRVDWAMRYGRPAIEDRLRALADQGCRRILLFALYPQYSAATSASVNDCAFRALAAMRWQPALRVVPPFHDHPAYIAALAATAEQALARLDWRPEKLLLSFHGMPKRSLEMGDPY
ncbi:MAG: ferrochelatase, partial [Alphaproteobacteria bacterium]